MLSTQTVSATRNVLTTQRQEALFCSTEIPSQKPASSVQTVQLTISVTTVRTVVWVSVQLWVEWKHGAIKQHRLVCRNVMEAYGVITPQVLGCVFRYAPKYRRNGRMILTCSVCSYVRILCTDRISREPVSSIAPILQTLTFLTKHLPMMVLIMTPVDALETVPKELSAIILPENATSHPKSVHSAGAMILIIVVYTNALVQLPGIRSGTTRPNFVLFSARKDCLLTVTRGLENVCPLVQGPMTSGEMSLERMIPLETRRPTGVRPTVWLPDTLRIGRRIDAKLDVQEIIM